MCDSSLLFMAVIDSYLHSMNTQATLSRLLTPCPGDVQLHNSPTSVAAGTFLVVQRLRLFAPNAGTTPHPLSGHLDSIPGQGTRSRIPQ